MSTHADRALTRRSFLAGSTAAIGAAALAGCTKSTNANATSGSGGTASYAIQNPTGIEPYTLEDENAMAVCFQLFDPLTRYNPDTKELEPLVAESWESNEDATEWTFQIRKGTKFHDGTEVTAKSFMNAWNRLVSPKTYETPSALSFHIAMIEGYDDVLTGDADQMTGVSCPDDYTLQVKLQNAYADLPYVLSTPTLGPVPDSALDDYEAYAKAPVGNGPFMMDGEWVDGQYVDLVRFDDYWGDKPIIDGIHFQVFRDTLTAYTEVQAGSCDNSNVPANQMSAAIEQYGSADEDGYVSNPGHQVFTGTMMYTQYLVFNMGNELIGSDERLRRALSVAINRQAICDTIYEGSATPASDIIPQAIAGSTEGTWATDYDPELAAQLLDEADYPADADGKRNLSIELMTNAANAKEEYEAMISDWAAVGIDATINRIEYAAMLDNYTSGNFQVAARGWYADYPIADNYLYPLFDSASSDNMSHFDDPEFDAMIDAARATVDNEARVEAMHECDVYLASIMPIAPLNWKAISRCSTARCNDLQITPGIQPIMSKMWLSE